MKTSANRRLEELARLEAYPCVTISIPFAGDGRTSHQNSVRLRNALRTARQLLDRAGLPAEDAEAVLRPVSERVDDVHFWAAPEGGVSLHAAPGFFRAVYADFALPERVTIGSRFAIRPLLPLLDRVERFYVLALSRNRVRLVEGGVDGARELALPGLPRDFEAAIGRLQFDSAVYAHTSSSAALGRRGALIHGHGDSDEEHFDADLESFCRRVAGALDRGIPDRGAPLVLAAVEEYLPMIRKAAGRLRLVDDAILGNPDQLSGRELADRARELVAAEVRGAVARQVERWLELRAGGRAIDELESIVRAAAAGQIETLFVATGTERWGTWEADLSRVALRDAPEPGDEDLLDLAAARTLARGGEVHALPPGSLPEGRGAAAILRFAQAGRGASASRTAA